MYASVELDFCLGATGRLMTVHIITPASVNDVNVEGKMA